MSRVRSKDTKPELVVRRLVHGLGFRYSLHGARLPGHPDLVFSGRRKVIFVHGCFWHRHQGCKRSTTPKSRIALWRRKFENNMRRDARVASRLRASGWKTLVVWECETARLDELGRRVKRFLEVMHAGD